MDDNWEYISKGPVHKGIKKHNQGVSLLQTKQTMNKANGLNGEQISK